MNQQWYFTNLPEQNPSCSASWATFWGLYAAWRHHIVASNLIIDLPVMTPAIHSRTSSLENCGTVLRTLHEQTWILEKWSYSTSSGFSLKQTPKITLAFNIPWREGWPLPSKLLVHQPSCPLPNHSLHHTQHHQVWNKQLVFSFLFHGFHGVMFVEINCPSTSNCFVFGKFLVIKGKRARLSNSYVLI